MKVSKKWLDTFFDSPLPDAEALSDALTFHAFEIDGIDKHGDDDILDVKVTPNRGHDCLCHRGIAKELSAILAIPLAKDPFAPGFDMSKKTDKITVSIEDNALCPRYIACCITGVKVGPSPAWLSQALEAIGQRSINNVVDATNFVMFNAGQPMHAFDAARLGSLHIGVRPARAGEQIEALDKKIYALGPSQLVITAADRPVGIAGVKGGEADRIDESTQDIVIESATFDGVAIRKAAQALKLRTDASSRFEQGLSPYLAEVGMRACAKLIQEIAGGTIEGFVDAYPDPQKQTYVACTVEQANKVLGTSLTGADVADAFARLGFAYKEQDGVFEVQPPPERLDIAIAEDLIEEVARIVGYDKIPATPLPAPQNPPAINKNFYDAEKARLDWTAKGYSEVFTSVFADKGERVVLNKVDGVRPYLRDTLLDGLADAWIKNVFNVELLGLKDIKLFEIGTVWKDGKEVTMIGTIKGNNKKVSSKEDIFEKSLVEHFEAPLVGPENPTQYDDLPLSHTSRYQSFSKYPYIVRDIAMWVPLESSASDIKNKIEDSIPVSQALQILNTQFGSRTVSIENIKGTPVFLMNIYLLDEFSKENKKSFAFRLIFQSYERTLVETEVNEIMQKVSEKLKAQGFEIR